MLKMVLVRGGNSCVVDQGDRQAHLRAGEFAVYDTRRPYEVACGVDGEQPTADDDLHVPAVDDAAAAQPARRAHCHALSGHRRPGRPDLAVPPPAGPQHRSLQPGGCRAVVGRRARGTGDAAGARAGRRRLGHAGEPQACPAHHRPGLHPPAPGRPRAVTGRDRRRPPRLAALPAPALPRRGADGVGVDPAATSGGLPPRPLRSGCSPPARSRPSRAGGVSRARPTSAGSSEPCTGCRPRSTAGVHAM